VDGWLGSLKHNSFDYGMKIVLFSIEMGYLGQYWRLKSQQMNLKKMTKTTV